MSDPPFGRSSAGLLHRLRPVPVDPADLRDVAPEVLPELATPRLRVVLADDRVDGPVLVLREDERTLRTPLRDLAEDMTAAGVAADARCARGGAGLLGGPPAGARRRGRERPGRGAGLDRRPAGRGRLARRRPPGRRSRCPGRRRRSAGAADVARIRAVAVGRSAAVETELRVQGPVALWSHPAVPLLASAPFAAPERVLERVAGAGLAMPDMHVVLTPGRPVAGAGAGCRGTAGRVDRRALRPAALAAPTALPWL